MIQFIVLGVVTISCLGLVTWAVHGSRSDREKLADARIDLAKEQEQHVLTRYQLKVLDERRNSAEARAKILEEIVAKNVEEDPNPDLARNDVTRRMLRLTKAWYDADRITSGSERTMPDESTTDSSEALVSSDGPDV